MRGLITLSALYPGRTNDLHVSVATSLHHNFLDHALLRHCLPSRCTFRVCLCLSALMSIAVCVCLLVPVSASPCLSVSVCVRPCLRVSSDYLEECWLQGVGRGPRRKRSPPARERKRHTTDHGTAQFASDNGRFYRRVRGTILISSRSRWTTLGPQMHRVRADMGDT